MSSQKSLHHVLFRELARHVPARSGLGYANDKNLALDNYQYDSQPHLIIVYYYTFKLHSRSLLVNILQLILKVRRL